MKPIIYNINLDVTKTSSQAEIKVRRGEVNSRQIAMKLYNGTTPIVLDESHTAVFEGRKPDGTLIFNDCTIDGNVIRHMLTAQTLVVAGCVKCQLVIYADAAILYSALFDIYVADNLLSDEDVSVITSSNEFNALESALHAVQLGVGVPPEISQIIIEPDQWELVMDGSGWECSPTNWIGNEAGNFFEDNYSYYFYSSSTVEDGISVNGFSFEPESGFRPYFYAPRKPSVYTSINAYVLKMLPSKSGGRKILNRTFGIFRELPFGGNTGQALVKASDAGFDVKWEDISKELKELPTGGLPGNALTLMEGNEVRWQAVAKTSGIVLNGDYWAASESPDGSIVWIYDAPVSTSDVFFDFHEHIISPFEYSFDEYNRCGVRFTSISDGCNAIIKAKRKPATDLSIKITRINTRVEGEA